MPPKKHATIWVAQPHTIAKISILKSYLKAWFPMMGRRQNNRQILYVDGFAGPGEYTNYPSGSPIAALEAAKAVLEKSGASWVAGDIHCVFIERDRKILEHLQTRVVPFQGIPKLHIHLLNMPFVDGLNKLRGQFPEPFQGGQPLFVFIDPFGATEVPFQSVAELLSSPRSEVLINLDADGIARIFQAGESAKHEKLLDESLPDRAWRETLSADQPFQEQCRRVLELYQAGLRSVSNVRYVFAFEMQSSAGAVNYYLVFASQHHRGLEKMKEAMKSMDQSGAYRFCDARVGQTTMFRFDNPADFSPLLFQRFVGRKTSYSEVHDFALNATPFTNPKGMLKILETENKISVKSIDIKRRKGTFNETMITSIEFVKG